MTKSQILLFVTLYQNLVQFLIKRILYIFSLVFTFSFAMHAQEVITLTNPSFEDTPAAGSPPAGWYDCGEKRFPLESPPDVQPSGDWDVTKPAQHGRSYLGMVVRENDTWESVSQKLNGSLKKGKKYSFSIYLCTSDIYKSATSRNRNTRVNYVTPAVLRIFGGQSYCDHGAILLAESKIVRNNDWQIYNFTFKPNRDISYITLEAYYETPVLFPYNGNILVDNASPIREIIDKNPKITNPTPPKAKENSTIAALKSNKVKAGQIIRIDELYFQADTSNINPSSFNVLNEVFNFLKKNKNVVIEVGGHTNGVPSDAYCQRLSTARAKEVAEYLIKKGIQRDRVKYKGYGKSQPIASDKTATGRKKNQRVEIKILST